MSNTATDTVIIGGVRWRHASALLAIVLLMFLASVAARDPWLAAFRATPELAFASDSIETVYGLFASGGWEHATNAGHDDVIRLVNWRLVSQFVTATACGLITLIGLAPILGGAASALIAAAASAGLVVFLPGPMYLFALPFSSEATGVMWMALLWLCELLIWRGERSRALQSAQCVVLVFGGMTGAYFLVGALLALVARMYVAGIRGRLASLAPYTVATGVGAGLRMAFADRLVLGGQVFGEVSWYQRLAEAFGPILPGAYAISAFVLILLFFETVFNRVRGEERERTYKGAIVLCAAIVAHPIVYAVAWQRGPVPGAAPLYYIVAIALIPLVWTPALVIRRIAGGSTLMPLVSLQNWRSGKSAQIGSSSVLIVLAATVCIGAEWPRHRSLFPAPARLEAMGGSVASFKEGVAISPEVALVDYRMTALDDERMRVSCLFMVNEPIEEDWLVGIWGYVRDEDIGALPEYQRNTAAREMIWQPTVGTAVWKGYVLGTFNVVANSRIPYEIFLQLFRTDAEGEVVRQERYREPVHLGVILPSDQSGLAVMKNSDFQKWEGPALKEWKVERNGMLAAGVRGEGESALEVPGGYPYNVVSQSLESMAPLGGRSIVFSVEARTSEEESVYPAIDVAGVKYRGNRHRGDGEWHRLFVEAEIPRGVKTRTFIVSMVHGNSPTTPCWFDDATVEVR